MEFSKTKMISMVVGWLVLLASGSVFADRPMTRDRPRAQPDFFHSKFYREKNERLRSERAASERGTEVRDESQPTSGTRTTGSGSGDI